MKALIELKKMLMQELEGVSRKGELSAGSLEFVHMLTDTIKNVDKICMLEEGGSSYSGEGMSSVGHYSRRGSYGNGSSGSGSYAGGSYAGGSYGGGSYGGGSYGGGSYAGGSYDGASYRRGGSYSRAEGEDMIKAKINERIQRGDMTAEEMSTLRRATQILEEF